MKVTIFLVAALAVGFSSALPTSSLGLLSDLFDFVQLLPKNEMITIFSEYLETDEEVQKVITFQSSEDYKKYILGMESVEEYQTLLKFLQSQGLDVYGYLELLHEFLEMPPYVPPPIYTVRKTGKGLKGLLQDWEAVLPKNEIAALSKEKLNTSEDYTHLYHLMNSSVYKKLFCACDASEAFQNVVSFGKQYGFDAYLIHEFTVKIFNIDMVYC